MDENKIIPYIEPIFRFCCKRLSNRYDAEDLASEIVCHILEGMNKYQIESLDAWVWRIAHNRYARFIDARNKNQIVLSCENELFDIADYSDIDEDNTQEQYEMVFRYLHTLSSEYRNIFVDYYISLAWTAQLEQFQKAYPDAFAKNVHTPPMGHFGDPELEIGRVCVQLAHPDFKYLTGETLTLEGGLGLRP